jgi:hypothetical protein
VTKKWIFLLPWRPWRVRLLLLMTPVAIWIALTFGGGAVQVDVGGAVVVSMPITSKLDGGREAYRAVTLGPLIISDPGFFYWAPEMLTHELHHVRQWEALGPGMLLAYPMTLGREFEDYLGDATMWEPEAHLGRRCPVVRWEQGEGFGAMPCWRF